MDLTSGMQRRRGLVRLLPAERLLLALVLATGALAVLGAVLLQRLVNWPPFIAGYLASLGFLAIGSYVRKVKEAPRLALALVALGLFAGFTAASSVLIYALLPLPNPMVDDQLAKIGHWIGYDWQGLVLAMTDYPRLTWMLGLVYQSALPQLVLTMCLLAAYGRDLALHRFLFVGMVTLAICVAIWWAWPSVGYVGVLPLSDAQMASAGLIYPQDYGGILTRLLQNGPGRITPEVITGVVGFPSYHTVMACLVVWYCGRTFLFLPALLANLAMLFATLVHGGHHLLDVLGGIVVFALGLWLARRVLGPQQP